MGSWHDDCNLLPIHNEWQQTRFSMVAHNCHGKTKNLTAKNKNTIRLKQNTSQQNQKPQGENKIPHGKTKSLTAKPNTSQQKQNIALVLLWLFASAVRYLVFAVKYLVLP